jgi:hypothetical protein
MVLAFDGVKQRLALAGAAPRGRLSAPADDKQAQRGSPSSADILMSRVAVEDRTVISPLTRYVPVIYYLMMYICPPESPARNSAPAARSGFRPRSSSSRRMTANRHEAGRDQPDPRSPSCPDVTRTGEQLASAARRPAAQGGFARTKLECALKSAARGLRVLSEGCCYTSAGGSKVARSGRSAMERRFFRQSWNVF